MADSTLYTRLKGLILDSVVLQQVLDWPTEIIEDYLAINDNIVEIARSFDIYTNAELITITEPYIVEPEDGTILLDSSVDTRVVIASLPTEPINKELHTFKSIDSTYGAIVSPSGNLIDNSGTIIPLATNEYITVKSDGTNWWKI